MRNPVTIENLSAYFFMFCTPKSVSYTHLYLKYSLDTEELRDRNQFLECTGMREKDRIRLIRTEMSLHASGSLIAGLFLSAFFFVLTPVIRHFSGAQILSYSLVFLLQTALYLLLHALVMYFLERHFIREILN